LEGIKWLNQNNYDKAISYFNNSLKFPDYLEIAVDAKAIWAYAWLAEAYKRKGEAGMSKSYADSLISAYTAGSWAGEKWPEVMYERAIAFKKLGQFDAFNAEVAEMEQKADNTLNAKTNTAQFTASVYLALDKERETAQAYFFKGLAAKAKGNAAQSATLLNKALELNPELITVNLYK
jgi:tetratricopeptide (TPR) repeat protein